MAWWWWLPAAAAAAAAAGCGRPRRAADAAAALPVSVKLMAEVGVATDAAAPVGAGPGNLSGQRQKVK